MSFFVLNADGTDFSTNVFGAAGEWLAVGDFAGLALSAAIYGLLSGFYISRATPGLVNSLGFYAFSTFSFLLFFSDVFLGNSLFSLVLIICSVKFFLYCVFRSRAPHAD